MMCASAESEKITECLSKLMNVLRSKDVDFCTTFLDYFFAVVEADYLYGYNDIRLNLDKVFYENEMCYEILRKCMWSGTNGMKQPMRGSNENMLMLFRAFHDAYVLAEPSIENARLAIPSSKEVSRGTYFRHTDVYWTWEEAYEDFMNVLKVNDTEENNLLVTFVEVLKVSGIAESALKVMKLPEEVVSKVGLTASQYCTGKVTLENLIDENTYLILKYNDKSTKQKLRIEMNDAFLDGTAKECILYDPSTYTLDSSAILRQSFNWGRTTNLCGLFKLAFISFKKVTGDVSAYAECIKTLREVDKNVKW